MIDQRCLALRHLSFLISEHCFHRYKNSLMSFVPFHLFAFDILKSEILPCELELGLHQIREMKSTSFLFTQYLTEDP